jgi:DNA-binding MarR family transcriptional regulator
MIRVTRTISKTQSESAAAAEVLLDELGPVLAGERAAFAHRCHERQISMAHLFLMTIIEKHGPLPMTRVAELVGSGLPTATGLVGRMEERGLVRREHDTRDRRVVLVSLTDEGGAELQTLHVARRERMATAIAHLTEGERAQLLSSIRTLRGAFERADQEGASA